MGIETFGGGESVVTETDSQNVTYAIMVNIEMKSEDRELCVPRPLYEYPLLKRLYKTRGGIAKIDPLWLVRKNGEDAIEHHVPLSRATLRAESARLAREFRLPMQSGGWYSIFEEVYGKGTTSTFYKSVSDLARGYADARKKALAEKRSMSIEEWEDLAKIVEPQLPDFDVVDSMKLDGVEMPQTSTSLAEEAPDIEDPLADLQDGLIAKGWSAEVALAVVTQHGAGKVSQQSINTISEMNAKPTTVQRLYDDYRELIKSALAEKK